eukprot:932415-Karenia_brevis.AAC.1
MALVEPGLQIRLQGAVRIHLKEQWISMVDHMMDEALRMAKKRDTEPSIQPEDVVNALKVEFLQFSGLSADGPVQPGVQPGALQAD